ncbi:unnamed protein product [Linum trigynum]|uniref:Uncharacterized protein n=1 Tax=Linum trigynum TaxID=586398 RepID=A0AAV2E1N2_9ROSI
MEQGQRLVETMKQELTTIKVILHGQAGLEEPWDTKLARLEALLGINAPEMSKIKTRRSMKKSHLWKVYFLILVVNSMRISMMRRRR